MNQDVVADGRRHQDEPPIEGNLAVAPTRSPSRPLIADADAGHRHAVLSSEFEQPFRQLHTSTLAQAPSLLGANRRRRQARALPRDPLGMTLDEGVRFTLRATARNRHAHTTVVLDAKEVPAGAAVTGGVDGWEGSIACRCERAVARRCG